MLAILLSSKIGRGALMCLALALALGAAWWHFSAVYEARGYAKRQAEDAAATAKLQSALDMSAARIATTADQLATAQINITAIQGAFNNAVAKDPIASACVPDAGSVQQWHGLWQASRAALATKPRK